MKLDVWLKTYNGMIGHPDLLFVGRLLFPESSPAFGETIAGFDVYAHVERPGQALPGLESMLDQFHARLATLPLSWFRRKQRLVEIAYHSRLGGALELFEHRPTPAEVSTIRTAYREIAEVLEERVRKSVKRSDGFDTEGFGAFLRSRRTTLDGVPDAAMGALLERLRASARARGVPSEDAAGTSGAETSSDVGEREPSPRRTRASGRRPKLVAINHDDHHARHVGRTEDGRQFFLTTPF